METDTVIKVENLVKEYPNGTRAVNNLALSLKRGEVFGLLGPNGSGKTTTILMMLGLTEPSGGMVDVLGFDPLRSPLEIKRRVAYMPDTVGFYDELSGWENLNYTARFLNLDSAERKRRIEESLKKMRLLDRKDDPVQTYSHGMKRRLGLAEVLVKKPEIAILDEPTQGLDPASAAEFLDLIQQLKTTEHITILLSSHLLNQVQSVCDRVGLFSKGSMLISGTVNELADRIFGGRITTHLSAKSGTAADLTEILRKEDGVTQVDTDDNGSYRIVSTREVRPQLARAVVEAGGEIYEIESSTHDLDSIYRAYYKELSHAA